MTRSFCASALAFALGVAPLAAQHAPAPPAATQQGGTSPQPAHGEAPAAHGTPAQPGAHHGPVVRLPFMKQPLGTVGQWLVKLFNFALFAGLLVFALKGVLGAAFRARAEELRDLLSQAEKEKAESELQMQRLEAQAAGLQQELDTLLARTEQDAAAEKQRILDTARAEADQILAQARQEIDYQQRIAEQELRALVATLATEGATRLLQAQLTGAAASDVLDRSIHQLGGES